MPHLLAHTSTDGSSSTKSNQESYPYIACFSWGNAVSDFQARLGDERPDDETVRVREKT
jgi:hypothetical protein